MANQFDKIASDITFFGTLVLAQLRQQLALVNRVNTDYKGASSAAGRKISIPVVEMSGSAQTRGIGGGVTRNSGKATAVEVVMQQITYSWELDNLEETFSNVNTVLEMAQRAAIKMADGVDALLTGLWPLIPYRVGPLDGSGLFNPTDKVKAFAQARKALKDNLAPTDRLFMILGTTEELNLTTLDIYTQAQQSGDPTQLRTGALKPIMGVQPYASQAVPTNITFTPADNTGWNTPTTSGVNAIGATTLNVAGLANGATITKGSIFTIAGGGTMPNGQPQPYSVTADVVASGGGAAALPISPALKAAPANGATITPVAYTGTHSINLIADPSAYLFVVRPQAAVPPGAGVLQMDFTDPVSQLTFRLSIEANIARDNAAGRAYTTVWTLDLLAGANIVRPELAVRAEGEA
ncbi:MAG TPA: hypothetical protein VF761_16720 [Gemmatimonadaceae bacterium]